MSNGDEESPGKKGEEDHKKEISDVSLMDMRILKKLNC